MTKINLSEQCVKAGAVEFTIRVCGYDYTSGGYIPNQWQAIIRHRDGNKPWGVGVDDDMFTASQKAHRHFFSLHGDEEKRSPRRVRAPAPRVRTRVRTK